MNWDNAPEWERDLAKFEQLESIAKSLAKIADALAERHTRREKIKTCGECDGTGIVTDYLENAAYPGKLIKTHKSCPYGCQPANKEPHA